MTEMATKITDEMSDQAFASLAAAVIKSEGRELPRPLPVVKEKKARPEVALPPLGTARPQKQSAEPVSKALLHARAEARRVTVIIHSLEVEYERVKASDAKKQPIRDAMLAVNRARRDLAKIERCIERVGRPARSAAEVLRATVGLQARAVDSDRQMQTDRERKLRSKLERPTREVKIESPYGPMFDQKTGRRINDDRVPRVLDTIDWMLRAHYIDRNGEAAARKVQDAWAAAPGNIRCALSAGEGGAGPGSRSPTEQQMWAGGILNDVRDELGSIDGLVIVRVCGIGMGVEQAARMEFAIPDNKPVPERQRDHIGLRLRMGLARLARLWRIASRPPQSGKGSPNLRSASARSDEFVLKQFSTQHAASVAADIGTLTGKNKTEIDALRERQKALSAREERRVGKRKPRQKNGAAPSQGA